VSSMPKAVERQCAELMVALKQVRPDLDPLSWLGAARPIVGAHMRAAYELAASGGTRKKGGAAPPKGLEVQCSELMLALQGILSRVVEGPWQERARPIVAKHMSAAYHLGAFGPESPPAEQLTEVPAASAPGEDPFRKQLIGEPAPGSSRSRPSRGRQGDLFGGST
jgi:hypothetical protein